MNITIKESLEHVCDVFNYFGIEYITAELLRRGKNDKKVKRRKVIIKYCFLINDLCLLYCFEFKRKFKPTYNEYIKKEILKVEEKFIKNNKRKNDMNEKKEDIEGLEDDDEEYFYEELDEDVNYFEDFYIISPLVIILLEYFQYPRLYHLIKCNFQMAKELLLCIGFLIDSIKLFENFDKRQPFYEKFFQNLCNNKKNIHKSTEKVDEHNNEEYEFYHFINEAMLLLSNRPYDLEVFECKYFYNFLQKLKKKKDIDEDQMANAEEKKKNKKEYEQKEENLALKKKKKREIEEEKEHNDDEGEKEENFNLDEYIHYDYSKYQENFLKFYSNKKYNDENDLYFDHNNNIYLVDITRNINKNCSKLIQLQNKISLNLSKLQNYDKTRLMLFHKFSELISTFTEPHNAVINLNNVKENYKLDKLHNGRKIDLSNNILFSVITDNEKEIKNVESKKLHNMINNNNNNKKNSFNRQTSSSSDYIEFLDNINYDFLNDKITINEFYVLNDISLYNKVIHIYKNGIDFFHFEQLRAVFWIWIQSIFSETLVLNERIEKSNEDKADINFYDINNNKFFYDNIEYRKNDDNLHLHVLSDLNDFEKNYKLLKEYLMHKGCTTGYNKISRNEKDLYTNKFNSITKYVNNLHIEFEAFYNYKKKSKNLNNEVFIEFLEEKKKNMVINSNVEREDYTNLANIVNKHLISIDKILKYQPILDFSQIVEGIKQQNFIRTIVDINKIELNDWNNMYAYHKKEKHKNNKQNIDSPGSNYIINLMSNSNYRINEKPSTYASTIFKYSDQFISNNDIYTFSDNIHKKNEEYSDFVKNKLDICTHNFYHILRKVEKYMNCVTYNL
ncbi:conserved Plasmodium protein, unknown function [Plasmodium relictum]|uniref:Uncharacterized protein n=1 Tax=Plasmodium relictum TaxID=85471 RepID=A0A1J1H0U6_PLARL|nr:conserved Plasmodium protein, unknown function [Plasmodium relictum]CRG98413.1 conserved Plasmodium protein, unknown function [Plasmodium relictum]